MIRKFCCIFAVVCIFVSSFAFVSSAAGSTFESDLYTVNSFVDMLGYQHDYFFIFGDEKGICIEFRYNPILTLSLHLTNSDLEFTCISNSALGFEIFVRDLKSGSVLYERYINVLGEFSSSYVQIYSSLPSESKLLPYVFSDFHYYSNSYGHNYAFYSSSSSFYPGQVVFKEQSSEYVVSPISEPVFDGYNYWLVLQNNSRALLMHFYFDLSFLSMYENTRFEFALKVHSDGDYDLQISNNFSEPSAFYMYFSIYDLSNGWFLGSDSRFISEQGITSAGIFADFMSYSKVRTYGIGFENDYGYPVSLPTILWNYDELLTQAITAQTLYLYTQLLEINRGIDVLEDYLNLIDIDLFAISDLLEDIRDSLLDEGESFTQPPTDALEDYLSDESKVYDVLPTGMQQNIDTAFGSADVVFSGNGAFALIRGLMQGLVFDVPKLSGFVFFALAVGIAVLILGRKVNSG